jgi:hypothetical protein
LYDFLYRDMDRVASYYAQLFQGTLTSTERSTGEKRTEDKGTKLDIHVASADIKTASEVSSAIKRISDPHDMLTTDALSYLMSNDHVSKDIDKAAHGSLVLASGTVNFADSSMLELALAGIKSQMKPTPRKGGPQPGQFDPTKMMVEYFGKIGLPSAYQLEYKPGRLIAGTIKDSGMQEPISTYYYRHGGAGLSDVFIIGIKELPAEPTNTVDSSMFLGLAQTAADALRTMLLPEKAIRVTPIAMFRKLI